MAPPRAGPTFECGPFFFFLAGDGDERGVTVRPVVREWNGKLLALSRPPSCRLAPRDAASAAGRGTDYKKAVVRHAMKTSSSSSPFFFLAGEERKFAVFTKFLRGLDATFPFFSHPVLSRLAYNCRRRRSIID